MRLFVIFCVFTLLSACASKPTSDVKIDKLRARLSLQDGSPISGDYDDYSPVLVRTPNDTVVLVFASNRPCSGCAGGAYHIFVAESGENYYGFGPLPFFDAPAVVNTGGTPHAIVDRTPVIAEWVEGNLQLFARLTAGIRGVQITNVSAGTANTPDVLPNSSRINDTILSFDFKEFKMISRNGATTFRSNVLSADAGVSVTNIDIAGATSLARVSTRTSGYGKAFFAAVGGELYATSLTTPLGPVENFNSALVDAELYLSSVGVLQTQYGGSTIVFSAGTTEGDQHDLYVVTSHDEASLWLGTGFFGGESLPNPPPYRMFMATTTDGNFGGIFAADQLCQSSSVAPDINVTYKALIVDTVGTRRACTSPNCATGGTSEHVDWVLQPNSTYIKTPDGVVIQTTNANGVFPFPLTNAVGTGKFWAGFINTNDWLSVTDSNYTCNDWVSTTGPGGSTGNAAATTSALLNDAVGDACGNAGKLICVEQPY